MCADIGGRRRGQVGIGTLIVFIAMVLVATIAGGVLVHTAGFLQTKSEQTGQEATDGVVNRLQVTSKVGRVSGTGDRNYIVIEEHGRTTREEPYDKRLTFPEGGTVRLDTLSDQKLVVEGQSSPTYTVTGGTTYRISRVGGKIRFTDTDNGVVVNTVAPPVTLETSRDADIMLGYPGDQYINHEDEVDFGSTLDGGGTATARFVKPDRVWTANLTVTAGSGVSAIDLTDATIIYRSEQRVRYLSYAPDGEPNHTAFAVSTIRGNGDGVLRDGEQAKITLDVDGVERFRHGLPLGERARLTIVTGNAKTTVFLDPPNTAGGRPHVEL